VTEAEIALLRSLAEADVVTFMPEDSTAGALVWFEATLESLRGLQKAGWAELEIADDRKRVRSSPAEGEGRRRTAHGGWAGGAAAAGRVTAARNPCMSAADCTTPYRADSVGPRRS
jgi:hypothetical protein